MTAPLVAQITRDVALQRVIRALGVSPLSLSGVGPGPAIVAEYLRDGVSRSSDTGQPRPVYVAGLLSRVRGQLEPLLPELVEKRDSAVGRVVLQPDSDDSQDLIRRTLEALHQLGDIEHVGNGYWVPTPVRLVPLGPSPEAKSPGADALMIGGASTRALQRTWHKEVCLRGITRILPGNVIPPSVRGDDARWQRFEDWLGLPSLPLRAWAAEIVSEAVCRLAAAAPDLRDFDVYVPSETRRGPQAFRWRPISTLSDAPSQISLCRTSATGLARGRRYWLGTFRSGAYGLRAVSEAELSGTIVRRFQYSLDLSADNATRADVEYTGTRVSLTLSSPLPPEEQRLLTAFASDDSRTPGQLPVRYGFSRDVAEMILDVIGRLGISTQ